MTSALKSKNEDLSSIFIFHQWFMTLSSENLELLNPFDIRPIKIYSIIFYDYKL